MLAQLEPLYGTQTPLVVSLLNCAHHMHVAATTQRHPGVPSLATRAPPQPGRPRRAERGPRTYSRTRTLRRARCARRVATALRQHARRRSRYQYHEPQGQNAPCVHLRAALTKKCMSYPSLRHNDETHSRPSVCASITTWSHWPAQAQRRSGCNSRRSAAGPGVAASVGQWHQDKAPAAGDSILGRGSRPGPDCRTGWCSRPAQEQARQTDWCSRPGPGCRKKTARESLQGAATPSSAAEARFALPLACHCLTRSAKHTCARPFRRPSVRRKRNGSGCRAIHPRTTTPLDGRRWRRATAADTARA
jgi:hypothetical protein